MSEEGQRDGAAAAGQRLRSVLLGLSPRLEVSNVATARDWSNRPTSINRNFVSETIKDPDAWNAWADQMLEMRAELQRAGRWGVRRDWGPRGDFDNLSMLVPTTDEAAIWMAATEIDGGSLANCSFAGLVFPGDVLFLRGRFSQMQADFSEARFHGDACFVGAQFLREASFRGAIFHAGAHFAETTFEDAARFQDCQFLDDADFTQASFASFTGFSRSRFCGAAEFFAAQGLAGSAVTFEDAVFERAPDFTQANFPQAPRLDNVTVREAVEDQDANLPAKWRNLKRLAIQGHDHEREMMFFAQEMLALRRWEYRGVRYWPRRMASHAYETFSAFGRSLIRPIVWWWTFVLLFTGANFAYGYWARSDHPDAQDLSPFACVNGPLDPLSAAFSLSVSKALVIGGITSGDRTAQDMACLFGIHGVGPDDGLPAGGYAPVIPGWIIAAGSVQLLLSTTLIALFLLALRNQFRIR